MVVFPVADPDDIQRRQFQSGERRDKAARFVDAGREHHHCPLVEHNLQLEPEIANCVEDNFFVGLPRRNNAAAHRERINLATAQRLDESGRRRVTQQDFLPCRRLDEHGPVLDDRQVEKVQLRKNLLQVRQLATGDKDQPTAGLLERGRACAGRHRVQVADPHRSVVAPVDGRVVSARWLDLPSTCQPLLRWDHRQQGVRRALRATLSRSFSANF
jgi:hypothetical protein